MHAVQLSESNTHNCVIFVSLKQHKKLRGKSAQVYNKVALRLDVYIHVDLAPHTGA